MLYTTRLSDEERRAPKFVLIDSIEQTVRSNSAEPSEPAVAVVPKCSDFVAIHQTQTGSSD